MYTGTIYPLEALQKLRFMFGINYLKVYAYAEGVYREAFILLGHKLTMTFAGAYGKGLAKGYFQERPIAAGLIEIDSMTT